MPRSVPVTPAQDDPVIGPVLEREVSWVVIDATGAQRLRWDAVSYVMSQSPLLWPIGLLARIYGAIGLGDPTYKLIGDSRKGFGAVTSRLLSPIAVDVRLGLPIKVGLAVIIAFCFLWNMAHLSPAAQSWTKVNPLNSVGYATGFTQKWTMFAPAPPTRDAFPVFAGGHMRVFPIMQLHL